MSTPSAAEGCAGPIASSHATHDGHGHAPDDGHRHGEVEHGTHSHTHLPEDVSPRRLVVVLVLLTAFLIGEVVVAVMSGSLALLSDAGHMLTDVAAIAVALWAIRISARPASGSWTFGWKRVEILSAAGNGLSLLVMSVLIGFESIRRLVQGTGVGGAPLLVVASVGIAVNILATWLLANGGRGSLNTEGVYQHVITDLFGFIGTVIAGLVITVTGFHRADPIASLVVVVLMLHAAWGLLRDSGRILLEAAPEHIDLDDIRTHLLQTRFVLDIHDLHVWTVTSSLPALSAHVVVEDACFSDGLAPGLLDEIQGCLAGHFDLEHSTFQFEPAGHTQHEAGTH